ncbi:MAG: ketoacyl-ACP synthase III, partial [Burkholderiaceae bacterium]|nr:ketoacyl-ACP synthase III [Burkholderiaceae bacterium]
MRQAIGREALTTGSRVVGVVSCVPAKVRTNDDFVGTFGQAGVADVVKMIGVHSRRQVGADTTTRDLCRFAAQSLLRNLAWEPESVDALLFVSQTPDFRLPPTACALQADLGIGPACVAFDINLGCSGYPYALWLGMTMIQTGAARRVLLAVGDTISRIVDPEDRATALLFGDAGTVTALEASDESTASHFVLGSDGEGVKNLIVPSGGFRDYMKCADSRLEGRLGTALYMDGSEIFNFTLRAVPPLVARTIELATSDGKQPDYYLFHQANQFMLKHLIKKAKIAPEQA